MSSIVNIRPEIEISTAVDVLETLADKFDLIVYNDDVNTFDHVTECLIAICDHEQIQAEQCTLIIHYRGKCQVKKGEYKELAAMCTALHDLGLSAAVE
jgi:ATP-dependent Clp protease adaptor protein ClpS